MLRLAEGGKCLTNARRRSRVRGENRAAPGSRSAPAGGSNPENAVLPPLVEAAAGSDASPILMKEFESAVERKNFTHRLQKVRARAHARGILSTGA